MRHSVLSTRSERTGRACMTDAEAIDRVGTGRFPVFAARDRSAWPRPGHAIVRLRTLA